MASATLHKVRSSLRSRDSAIHPRKESYKWWLLANVMLGTFMSVLDSTIVNVGLPKIMASFGVSLDQIEWVLTAYLLALAVMLPISGWLAENYGYKRTYFLGMAMFTVGSAFCGMAGNEEMLILARVLQGLGAGTIMPIGMAIVSREFPPDKRGVAMGFWAISAAASVSFGPLIGGYLVDKFDWPLIFEVNVPVGIIALFATFLIQQEYKNKHKRKFDPWGFGAAVVFLPVLLYALTDGTAKANAEGYASPHILLCFAIAAIAFTVFVVAELNVDEPFMDLRLLKERTFGLSTLIVFVFGIGMFGTPFILPLYLQNSLGWSAIQAGAVFLPVGIIQGIVAPISGKLSTKINDKVIIFVGVCFVIASFVVNYFLSYQTELDYIMMSLYFRGIGMGLLFTPLSALALSRVPQDKMAQASSMFNVSRQIGGSFGVSLLSSMLTVRTVFHMQHFGEAINPNSPTYGATLGKMAFHFQQTAGSALSESFQQAQAVLLSHVQQQAYIQAIADDFLIAGLITALGLIPVLLLRTHKKKKASKLANPSK